MAGTVSRLPGMEYPCGAAGRAEKRSAAAASVAGGGLRGTRQPAQAHARVETTHELRFETGMNELDRVLGGGAVKGSLVLVGGCPPASASPP